MGPFGSRVRPDAFGAPLYFEFASYGISSRVENGQAKPSQAKPRVIGSGKGANDPAKVASRCVEPAATALHRTAHCIGRHSFLSLAELS